MKSKSNVYLYLGSLVNDDTIPNNSVNNDNSQDASSPDHQAENHHNDAKISSGNGSNSETETATEETSNGPIKVHFLKKDPRTS